MPCRLPSLPLAANFFVLVNGLNRKDSFSKPAVIRRLFLSSFVHSCECQSSRFIVPDLLLFFVPAAFVKWLTHPGVESL